MSLQVIRDCINSVANASMEEPPRVAVVDLVAALHLIVNELQKAGAA